jgi:hypothetical protein
MPNPAIFDLTTGFPDPEVPDGFELRCGSCRESWVCDDHDDPDWREGGWFDFDFGKARCSACAHKPGDPFGTLFIQRVAWTAKERLGDAQAAGGWYPASRSLVKHMGRIPLSPQEFSILNIIEAERTTPTPVQISHKDIAQRAGYAEDGRQVQRIVNKLAQRGILEIEEVIVPGRAGKGQEANRYTTDGARRIGELLWHNEREHRRPDDGLPELLADLEAGAGVRVAELAERRAQRERQKDAHRHRWPEAA